jgi:hypothetical protein
LLSDHPESGAFVSALPSDSPATGFSSSVDRVPIQQRPSVSGLSLYVGGARQGIASRAVAERAPELEGYSGCLFAQAGRSLVVCVVAGSVAAPSLVPFL